MEKLREERPVVQFLREKAAAPAKTEVPVSAARGVQQSHNQSAWDLGAFRALMFLASRASIFRPLFSSNLPSRLS